MNAPQISVVIATQNSTSYLCPCLDSLRNQERSAAAEIIVADASTDGSAEIIRNCYPDVLLLHCDRPLGLPGLLREALCQARGQIIAVTDAYCRFPPQWLANLRQAHEMDYAVIGGAVENGNSDGLFGWACFFADYGAFMLPAQPRVTPLLAGNHVSYKKWLLDQKLGSMDDGFWKVFFHRDLEREGIQFLFDPSLVVYYTRRNTLVGFLTRYYRNARLFAAFRCKRISPASRFLRVIASPALPPLLLYQRLRAGLTKKAHQLRSLLSLPLLALFVTVWAAGEFSGYLQGPNRLCNERAQ